MSKNLMTASKQWMSRTDDQRFTSLAELKAAVSKRKDESFTQQVRSDRLQVAFRESDQDLRLVAPGREDKPLELTNWSFGQLAQLASAPASYLRQLPAQLAAQNLQYGLENRADRPDALLYGMSNGDDHVAALTSVKYGRIYDLQVVNAVEQANPEGRWQVPAASYAARDPKRATTLYASDRDVFIFLVDPVNEIEVNGDKLFRGFIVWNSEVGSQVFGLQTFLYRYVCDNRIIWGATQVKELRIRHTSGAPERFAYEGARQLAAYAEESAAATIAGVKKAQETICPTGKDKTVEQWLQASGFTLAQAKQTVTFAKAEEGDARTVWQVVNGATAYARSIGHTDARREVESLAGKLMDKIGE